MSKVIDFIIVGCFIMGMVAVLFGWIAMMTIPGWPFKLMGFIGFLNQIAMICSFINDVIL